MKTESLEACKGEQNDYRPPIDEGGPAYPIPFDPSGEQRGHEWNWSGGMSLRDKFAGDALIGLLSHHGHDGDPSQYAYKIADQMIKARKGNQK